MSFVHLHVHTQYSLDSMASIEGLFDRAEELGMPALAITDSGTLSGVKHFLNCASSHPAVKPIVGCDLGIIHDDGRINLVTLLARNLTGYRHLVRIVTEANLNDALPASVVGQAFIEKYHGGLICIASGVGDVHWYWRVFGDDFYWEVRNDAGTPHDVKVVATNDVFFVRKDDGPAYDCYRCIEADIRIDELPEQEREHQEYLKSEEEMMALFQTHPEALANTLEVAAKVERYSIEGLSGKASIKSAELLRSMTWEGARERYGENLTKVQKERLNVELDIICEAGYPDCFLFARDIVEAARNLGSLVGYGRGRIVGSAVAYCLGITALDPLLYGFPFEPVLNPACPKPPLIRIDVENVAMLRDIIEDKYGTDHVIRPVAFGHLLARSADREMERIFCEVLDNSDEAKRFARELEGVIRAVSPHYCAVFYSRESFSNLIPLCRVKDRFAGEKVRASQYDSQSLEEMGMIRFDILPQRNLSVIHDCLDLIVERHGRHIDRKHDILEKPVDPDVLAVFCNKVSKIMVAHPIGAGEALAYYELAWFKKRFPLEYFEARLKNAGYDEEREEILEECRSLGIHLETTYKKEKYNEVTS